MLSLSRLAGLAFVILLGNLHASAQIVGLPECAAGCADQAASGAGCRLSQKDCLCGSVSFIGAVLQCSVHACSTNEQSRVQSVMSSFCPAPSTTATVTSVSTFIPDPSPPGHGVTTTVTGGGGGGGGTHVTTTTTVGGGGGGGGGTTVTAATTATATATAPSQSGSGASASSSASAGTSSTIPPSMVTIPNMSTVATTSTNQPFGASTTTPNGSSVTITNGGLEPLCFAVGIVIGMIMIL